MGIFANSWRHIRRSPYQAFAAVSIMVLTFTVSGLFVIVSFGSSIVLSHFEKKPQIVVFFKDTKPETEINSLTEKLKSSNTISEVKFISKEEALTIYKEQFKNDPLLLEMVSADILPASIEVSAVEITQLPFIAKELEKEPDIEQIVFQEDLVDMLVKWTTAVRYIGLVLVAFLGVVAFFTVMTVISMKISLRREEIEILRLVGATSGYVRGPFLAEGMFYGLVGALTASTINLFLLIYTSTFLQVIFVGIPLFPLPFIFYPLYAMGMIVAGMLLGVLASVLAVNRYIQ